jgi:glycosyltransferase involved in cell wall biosynthesis
MYKSSARRLQTLQLADIAISYSTAVDRHLARNGIARRALVPLFATMAPVDVPTVPGRVLYAGRLVASKGVATLVRAAAQVDCELVICGEGRDREALERLADKLAVSQRTRFAGWLDEASLAREVGAAQIVAMPSLWPEPFGLVGIEAQAAGRPVVASMTGGVGDWLEPDVTGIAVRPGDAPQLAAALGRLLGDEAMCARLGAAGRAMVERRFTARTHSAALIEAYGKAVAARSA